MPVIAVVIPCYKVTRHILSVLNSIGPEVRQIFVVDDKCPEGSGAFVAAHVADARIRILYHEVNQGVGGAVMTGYAAAIEAGAEIIVKIDGDGQMDPSLIPQFAAPIADGTADYVKGNRFFNLDNITRMPKIRIFGNAALSFMTKLSTGYWDIFDPTNGYTAVHAGVAALLPVPKIAKRYFFESDMLFRLNLVRARVVDLPMDAKYEDEESNLKINKIFVEFLSGHFRNFCKRIFYTYYLRDFSIASIEFLLSLILISFGTLFGIAAWITGASSGQITSAGTVMLASLPIFVGLNLLLAAINFDIAMTPKRAVHQQLSLRRALHRRLVTGTVREEGVNHPSSAS